MRIQAARFIDFRNVASAHIDFSPRLTALIGPNGQGKTNLLEALYTVAALRPLRSVPRSSLIRSGTTRAEVSVTIESGKTGLVHHLGVRLEARARMLTKDEKRAEASTFLGHFVAVAFTPDDLEISKAGPDARRRFLDRAILNTRPAYLERALRYQKAVKARNKLLQTGADPMLLDAYDVAVAEPGAELTAHRAAYVRLLQPRVVQTFADIARPAPSLEVEYNSALGEPDADVATLKARFLDALQRRRKHDLLKRTTSIGPHLDDLHLMLDGVSTRQRASQGQHRAVVLALKLAEIELLSDTLGEPPVLLLDDISSELDHERTQHLFESVERQKGQVVLTTTDAALLKELPSLGEAPLRYAIDSGTVRPWPSGA
ncbi:MAG: DNA replication/repair protein RecF [Myxococcota bacterium]